MFQEDKEIAGGKVAHPCLWAWRKRVDEAEERGYFTEREKADAADWDLCAVGEARQQGFALGEDANGGPDDLTLDMLGCAFYDYAVALDKFARARELLTAIENRLAELFG